jgi:hypothetical protein
MRDGKIREHEVKPLELIWRKFPERYSAANTVHVDDLSRNFALNPQQVSRPLPVAGFSLCDL